MDGHSPARRADGPAGKAPTIHVGEESRSPLLFSSRTNSDDRLPADPLGRIESGDGIDEGRDVADVCTQSSVPHSLDDLTQLGAIGHENKVDRQAVGGPRLGRPGDGYQRSSGSN